MLIKTVFIMAEKQRQPEYLSTDEKINKMWHNLNQGTPFSQEKE